MIDSVSHSTSIAGDASFTTGIAAETPHPLERLPVGSVGHELFRKPSKFDFFEAVLLLQQLAASEVDQPAAPIGKFAQPSQESLRFTVPHSQAFPTASIESIRWDAQQQRPQVCINFMGLTGPSGTLPRSYTQRLQQIEATSRHTDRHALRDWLDNFNHRMVSLFFDAWAKYRFPVAIRRQQFEPAKRKPSPTIVRVALSAIAGLSPPEPETKPHQAERNAHAAAASSQPQPSDEAKADQNESPPSAGTIDRDELLGLAGLLSQRPMNVANLQSALKQALGVPVRVKQFDSCWLNLETESQSRLGVEKCKLGFDTMLGERIWSRQQKVQIEVGPLSARDFQRFLPPSENHLGDGFRRLGEMVRVCVGPSLDFDIRPLLKIEQPLETQLTAETSLTRLGIDSWIGTPDDTAVANDAIFPGV
ncbi:type VI secretion system baseplate subunit TssG [Rosistilla oblonga]|uniref:type VI secretion system baseplate subunit TssG n=1 Tax=Rosistilla oblonga TaxID=2527990 RepID=UPI003A97A67E